MDKQGIRLAKRGDAIRMWSDLHRDLFIYWMDKIPEGQELWLMLSEKSPKRTEAQHRYYFFYLRLIADETGEEVEVLHELFKNKFIKPKEKMYHATGDVIKIYPSTKELTIKEFKHYIDQIELETGIEAPDTGMNGLLDYYQKAGL